MLYAQDKPQESATTLPVHQGRVLLLDADALAFSGLDAMAPTARAQLAQGMLITLVQAHRHRATALVTTLHQDKTQARLLHLVNFWRLVLDMARIERDRATHDRAALEALKAIGQDHDAALLVKLSGTARAIAATLQATTFAELSGLDVMLPARAPIASPLH